MREAQPPKTAIASHIFTDCAGWPVCEVAFWVRDEHRAQFIDRLAKFIEREFKLNQKDPGETDPG